jgi:mannose-6-phosphate isomerase-like protein (cupin superfamily)
MNLNFLGIVFWRMFGNLKMANFIIRKVTSLNSPNFVMNPADLVDYFPGLESFKLKRIYWITDPKNELSTGQHAHSDESGIFVIVNGKANMILNDGDKKIVKRVSAGHIIWVPKFCWHGFEKMSVDFILMVLSDKNYDHERKGYILDFKDLQ